MTILTSTQVIALLNSPTSPYPYQLPFYAEVQQFPIYPYGTCVKVQPESTDKNIQIVVDDNSFEIKVYIRYTRGLDLEESDQTTIETTILRTLAAADPLSASQIYSLGKNWNRTPLNSDDMYGSVSTLRVTIRDISSTSGVGILGSGMTLQLNSDSTPLNIVLLSSTNNDGTTLTSHHIDTGNQFWDPVEFESGEFYITYENTLAIQSTIQSLASSGTEVKGQIIRNGVSTNYLFLVGDTTKAGQFDNIEKATTHIVVNGTW
jgi:hypothetical protein